MNLNSKFLILVAMAVLAAAFGVFGLTSLDAGNTMRGLLSYILACSLVTCMCVVAGSAYVAERFAAMHASTAALWKEYYAATQAASAEISFAYAGACIPEPKADPQARQRLDLEHSLVQAAGHRLAENPQNASDLAKGIKTFMVTLHGTADTALPVIDPGPDSLEREIQVKAGPIAPCKGINCGCTDGRSHSNECIVEAAMIQGWAGEKEAQDAFAAIKSKTFSDGTTASGGVVPQAAATPKHGDDAIEAEIQAKANKAPRVTPEAMQAEIVSESYFTAADGVRGASSGKPGAGLLPEYVTYDGSPLSLLTVCVLVLRNGFTVVGYSACASPENFNADIGQRIARENAEREIWPLLGFRLRDELARPMLTEADAAADLAGVPRPA